MPDETKAKPDTPPESDATRRLKERFDKLLATPAAKGSGSIRLGGRPIAYRSCAEFIPVAGSDGEPEAAVMTTAYLQDGVAASARGVCFAFNGGPGSASIWLHLGALGPKRVVVPDDGSMPQPPYAVSDNPLTWLKHFDLVFIDPPHTGWSTTASEAARKKMLSVDGDIEALAEVMRLWLTRHQRWGSPVYLAGESYGTTRGAGLANKLQELGVVLSGAILVSLAMDLQGIVFAPANDLPYALFLPALANVAQYHGLLRGELGASGQAARAAAEAPSSPRSNPWYCATLANAGRNSA
jgi:carboxypeptidase C (cathepsin A)